MSSSILFSNNIRHVLLGLNSGLPNLVFCLHLQQQENMKTCPISAVHSHHILPSIYSVVLGMLQGSPLAVPFRIHLRTCCPWICLTSFFNLLTLSSPTAFWQPFWWCTKALSLLCFRSGVLLVSTNSPQFCHCGIWWKILHSLYPPTSWFCEAQS